MILQAKTSPKLNPRFRPETLYKKIMISECERAALYFLCLNPKLPEAHLLERRSYRIATRLLNQARSLGLQILWTTIPSRDDRSHTNKEIALSLDLGLTFGYRPACENTPGTELRFSSSNPLFAELLLYQFGELPYPQIKGQYRLSAQEFGNARQNWSEPLTWKPAKCVHVDPGSMHLLANHVFISCLHNSASSRFLRQLLLLRL